MELASGLQILSREACLISWCLQRSMACQGLTMRPYMLPGLLRAVLSGVAEGGPAAGLAKGDALSLRGELSVCAACKNSCT